MKYLSILISLIICFSCNNDVSKNEDGRNEYDATNKRVLSKDTLIMLVKQDLYKKSSEFEIEDIGLIEVGDRHFEGFFKTIEPTGKFSYVIDVKYDNESFWIRVVDSEKIE